MCLVLFMEDEALQLGLSALLCRLPLNLDVSAAVDEADFARRVKESRPDFVIVTNALGAALLALRDEVAGPRWLMIVEEYQVAEEGGLAILPADGYLVRQNLSAEGLERALRQLAVGEMAIPLALGRQLMRRASGAAPAPRLATLTARESETLMLLVRGLSNKQIGRRLRISEHGAKRLVSSVLLKLDAANRTSAVVNAIKAGLVDEKELAGTA
ncbi:DNA-binding response regulator, NarL/FixJ family, contains REC and HTH domains [Streptomyces sp. Ncost-T6T-1]|nr:DNA-binding response regulator, NarL/FixJ family, contains REC and HTH domains [Streptomyces sp. Ncost-T6T-1]